MFYENLFTAILLALMFLILYNAIYKMYVIYILYIYIIFEKRIVCIKYYVLININLLMSTWVRCGPAANRKKIGCNLIRGGIREATKGRADHSHASTMLLRLRFIATLRRLQVARRREIIFLSDRVCVCRTDMYSSSKNLV